MKPNSKRSAKRSRQSGDFQQSSKFVETQRIGSEASEVQKFFALEDWESKAFTPEEAAAMRKAADVLNRGLPWLSAIPEQAGKVAVCAIYPRSRLGARQADWLLRAIYDSQQRSPDINSAAREIIEIVTAPYDPMIADEWIKYAPKESLFWLICSLHKSLGFEGSFQPKTGRELFAAIAERFAYLESYKPTAGDYAIEALQDAFVGLMQKNYAWGKKGLPTKGEVTKMAKELFDKGQKPKPKGGWTKLREDAGLGFLRPGQAGRPTRKEVDETIRAKQSALSTTTKFVNKEFGGDWNRWDVIMKMALGGEKLALQSEQERLNDQYGQPHLPNDGDGESE
jgi:hypothetical protein